MLFLFDTPEIRKVGEEMLTLMKGTDKRAAVDDGIDACRYALVDIPWDWTVVQGKGPEATKRKEKPKELMRGNDFAEEQRQRGFDQEEVVSDAFADEIDFWNEQMGS
jgi:hypothetical protein